MENRKYNVKREDIYVGEVIRTTSGIYRYDGDSNHFLTKPGELTVGSYFHYRSMLFVPNPESLSNDLLYQSPSYPVLNVSDDELCLSIGENKIVIKDACNLNELLEYFGYKKELTYEDIIELRRTFFTGRFAKDNCELFGYKETMVDDVTFYKNGEIVTDPKELERRRIEFISEQKAGHRMFSSNSEGILSHDYWEVLDRLGDNSIKDALLWQEKMNSFTPHKEEGPIKKLSRY